jgi:putative transposase
MNDTLVSYEFIRSALKKLDKFEQTAAKLGLLRAHQDVREIGRLHTNYPNARAEYDYSKYGVFLFPNDNWDEPLMYYSGLGIDHHSTMFKATCLTLAPAARDTVRLFKRSVLPQSLWLPSHLSSYAQRWDTFGVERVSAIDNGMELIAHAAILVYMLLGVIVLRMPPGRGDLKGTVERTHSTMETQFVSTLPGYVSRHERGMNPRYDYVRKQAKLKANMTVAQYLERECKYICEYGDTKHPRFRANRASVFRNGLAQAPPLLPTGRIQLRCLFSLTYQVKLLREGVEVERVKYNSPELAAAYRVYSGMVTVKLDPEDVTSVLVLVPGYIEPIEARWTTYDLPVAISQETLSVVLSRLQAKYPGVLENDEDLNYIVLNELHDLEKMSGPSTPGKTPRSDAQAATHVSATPVPSAASVGTATGAPQPDVNDLLGGSVIADD